MTSKHEMFPALAPARTPLIGTRQAVTGQTLVMPADDFPVYKEFVAAYHDELKPQGRLEEQSVQTIADTQWRLNRLRAAEMNLLAMGFPATPQRENAPERQVRTAISNAATFKELVGELVQFSKMEERLTAILLEALSLLERQQKSRPVPPAKVDTLRRLHKVA